MRRLIILFAFCVSCFTARAQNVVKPYGIKDTIDLPQVRVTTLKALKMLELPMMTTTERNAIPVIPGKSSGIIHNTTTGKLNYYNGQNWIEMATLP